MRNRRLSYIAATWVTLCLAASFLTFSTQAYAAQRLALVLGNGDYEFGRLKNPVSDAKLIATSLRDVGFNVFEHLDADQRSMKRAIVGFGKALAEAGEDAVGIVYYAGHGVQYSGENYMIPVGAQIEDEIDVDIEGIRASTLLAALDRAGNRLNIVILDACRNNPFASGSRSAANGLARMDAPSGTLLAYSTSPGNVALDGTGKNSPYTRALARAIKTPGAKVEDVFKTVRISVMERTNDKQVPWEASSLTGDFFFVEDVPAATPAPASQLASVGPTNQELEIEYWKSIANSDSASLFQSYLDRFPNGLFAAIAEERVQQLTQQQNPAANAEIVYFQAIQNSTDPADFEAYLRTYPNGTFAPIARQRIGTLKTRQDQRAVENNQDLEKQLWDEVKNSEDPAFVETFLEKYPTSIFADLAKARIESLETRRLNSQQVASASPTVTLAPSVSSHWSGKATTHGATGWGITWCRAGQNLDITITVENGVVSGRIPETSEGPKSFTGTLQSGTLQAKLPGQYRVSGKLSGNTLNGTIRNAALWDICGAKFTATLIPSLPNADLESQPKANQRSESQLASASPAASVGAPGRALWQGVATTRGEPYYGVTWCKGGQNLNMVLTISSSTATGHIESKDGSKIPVSGAVSDNRMSAKFVADGYRFVLAGTFEDAVLTGRIDSKGFTELCGAKFTLKPAP